MNTNISNRKVSAIRNGMLFENFSKAELAELNSNSTSNTIQFSKPEQIIEKLTQIIENYPNVELCPMLSRAKAQLCL